MTDLSRPLLVLYIVWHPDFDDGIEIANILRDHFRRKLYENVTGGTGLSVIYRFAAAPGAAMPLPIDLTEAETTAVVVLADRHLAADAAWTGYVRELVERTEAEGFGKRVFPVAIDADVLGALGIEEQALRWDLWATARNERCARLTWELTHEFCRILRYFLEQLKRPDLDADGLAAYLKKVQVFLSHSKHDEDGVRIARSIRDWLHTGHGVASFFDVHDIPAGLRFNKVLLQQVRVSAMVAIHTDSYSSREWCRREIIEAKRHDVPLVVADSISDREERGFPYLGNVPVVRFVHNGVPRIEVVIGRLLDEVLKDFLWRCRVQLSIDTVDPRVIFIPRTPELISLANLPKEGDLPLPILVYPDPPISAEEELLFSEIAPRVQLRSFTEWMSGAIR
ncbi:toll/interleukin-1 receptor domain-containing protein [Massilia violaceinigra]|uniref:Toll/interleukin-1 receptor domain-containing protein n=1 Tax=Massilia violaceinigra TaxID=2045208 RepID=A0ABY4AHX6_9BURK|nr:toll/interleukin-1 receptor domain-containing protein [Massilia violaceinigra]UOD32168.1 toll/interleukin-1 receptor domain-containing protein [Massilia violaceinigra]